MVNEENFEVVIQEEEIVRYRRAVSHLTRKLDRRLIPFLALLEIARFSFQVAIGHAPLSSFKDDLELTPDENNWATSAFFIGFVSIFLPLVCLQAIILICSWYSPFRVVWYCELLVRHVFYR